MGEKPCSRRNLPYPRPARGSRNRPGANFAGFFPSRTYRGVAMLDNISSRVHPAGGRRKLPPEPGKPRKAMTESPALAGNPRLFPPSPETPRPACHAGGRGFESRRSRKKPAKCHIALSGRTRKSGRLHKRAFGWGRNGRKPTETLPGVAKTSRFLVASRPTAKAACDYTKWPEGQGSPSDAVESS